MHVVATAGHVDHGKSTLVQALTGRDPDRLEEERRRGLSIELGYAWIDLAGVGEVAFVDVPGHQRFIATTLAGVGPVPVVMFVVAADDPWMPQAAEHLAALDALGVRHGILVVTRADLADPGPALARAQAELGRTTLAAAPAVVVSARTGAGLDELRAALTGVLSSVPHPDPAADVRLWVDRRFHVRGAGTVVTGTLPEGRIAVGDGLLAGDVEVRVRGVHSLERPREQVVGVARVALDLGGRAPARLSRGDTLVTPGAFAATSLVDVRLSGSGDVPEQPVLHVGSALVGVRTRRIGDDLFRLRLEQPLPLRVRDRAILRDPGSRSIWGAVVLDPAPPPIRRRGAVRRAEDLALHDGSLSAELRLRGVVRRSLLRRIGVPTGPLPPGSISTGDWLVGPELAATLHARLVDAVETTADDIDPGLSPAAAAHLLDLPTADLVGELVRPPLRSDRGRIVGSRGGTVPTRLESALARLRDSLTAAPFSAPDAATLAGLGLDPHAVAALHRSGHLLRLAENVVLLPGADDQAVEVLRKLPAPFTTSEARRALGTSRRVALPLLAHLDETGRTLRLPDDRRRLRGPTAG